MIYADGLQFGENQEEMLQMDKMGFPYACYYREMDNKFHTIVPWHWHKSLEIDYIIEGEMLFLTQEKEVLLKAGDICLINSGTIHSFKTEVRGEGCKFYAHIFDMTFLTGERNSLIAQKYFLPIKGNDSLPTWIFSYGTKANEQMCMHFMNVVKLDEAASFGYEMFIREELSHLWCILFQEIGNTFEMTYAKKRADEKRAKAMIQFIHQYYGENLELNDIAKVAQVSRQECMRCFRKYIHISPMAYLTEYRVRVAAEQLLYMDQTITMISENCGFSSAGYFTKVFRNIMGCTPREYRQIGKNPVGKV